MELTSSTGILKKNLFVQGSHESIKRLSKYLVSPTWLPQEFQNKNVLYESIKRLKGKTRKFLFFQGSIWQNNSVSSVCTAPHQSTECCRHSSTIPSIALHCTGLLRAVSQREPHREWDSGGCTFIETLTGEQNLPGVGHYEKLTTTVQCALGHTTKQTSSQLVSHCGCGCLWGRQVGKS